MPLKFIFYSDSHLGFDFPITSRSKRTRRGADFFDNFHRVYQYAIEQKIDLLVHGGDLFYRSKIPTKLANHVYLMLHEYAAQKITTIIVPGNHERSHLPQSLLAQDRNIWVFKQPQTYTFNTGAASLSFSGFPFASGNIRHNFRDLVAQTSWQQARAHTKILCLHQAIEGATVGPQNYTFRNRGDVININEIPPDFALVLCGHIHRRQILTTASGVPVVHAGSLERTSFAEKDEPKGFYEISFHSVGSKPDIKFIPLPTRPMIHIDLTPVATQSEGLKLLRKKTSGLPLNAIVRIHTNHSLPVAGVRANVPESMIVYIHNTYFR